MDRPQRQLFKLVDIVAQLRGADGCPWDQEQTLLSMRPYLLEEVYELLEAIENDGGEDGLEGELGDTLFVLLLLVQIATDAGRLTLDSVCKRIIGKMITRHPHVFGEGDHSEEPGGIAAWEARKQTPGRSRLAGVPKGLPALLQAHRQSEKASAVGLDWSSPTQVFDKINEEISELREAITLQDSNAIEHEVGDLLLSVANLARHLNAPPEAALRRANQRFAQRFSAVERMAEEEGLSLSCSTDEGLLDALWERAKVMERTC
jgi:MazG family protein